MILYKCFIGEACGEGSLIELKNVLLAKQFQYSCYDIYGDLSDPDQKNDLIQSAVQIILAIKNGKSFVSLICFFLLLSYY